MFTLAAGEERDIIFRLGAGRDREHASELAKRLRKEGSASAALQRVKEYWQQTLGAVQIDTPDASLNVLANGWLVYQTLACRLWARSGFYQSGGAFGFRDQLQDAMALVHTQPALLREQLLLCAQRQYEQGDVQHWWHPPSGRGVRTRCSDDYLWLPLAACRYVQSTGDRGILDVPVSYLDGRALDADEESYYDLPVSSSLSASFYQHCVKAIEHGLRFGKHGLPLMGSGDWNDGMNLVGIDGEGESVWLGFFLFDVLTSFADVARLQGDTAFVTRCREQADTLRRNLAQHAWDGQWYKRAWFDDGTPLGSSANAECAIDSISQSWSVLSGGGDADRSRKAMDAVDRYLVNRQQGLVQLLDPPFDQSALNPGYIKGYLPGVRENGGQYTHAAVWTAMAFAALGDSTRARELLTLINPINHTLTADAVATYKTEPYVVAADVYAVAPHTGRGGWSWYTGSAGWLYRLIVESLMGLRRESDRLFIHPCLPPEWNACAMSYRFGETGYRINVIRVKDGEGNVTAGPGALSVRLDGVDVGDQGVPLTDDQLEHTIEVELG
jgi:cellobiose phosphorylase